MTKILIVDDELKIREVVREYSILNNYEVKEAKDGFEAIEMVTNEDFDCVVLDIMMPNLDGFTACKKIKAIKKIPVIMLSARQDEYDKLLSFEIGVDDYVVKPFSPRELMARIKVVIARYQGVENQILKFSGLEIDTKGRVVSIDGKRCNLTPKEIDLLLYLVKNKNIALSRNDLLESVWGYDYYGDERTVDTHVKMVRRNLGKYRYFIVTVRGMGYKFEA